MTTNPDLSIIPKPRLVLDYLDYFRGQEQDDTDVAEFVFAAAVPGVTLYALGMAGFATFVEWYHEQTSGRTEKGRTIDLRQELAPITQCPSVTLGQIAADPILANAKVLAQRIERGDAREDDLERDVLYESYPHVVALAEDLIDMCRRREERIVEMLADEEARDRNEQEA